MSRTTILHIYPNEKIELGERLHNSYGSAFYVWDYMIKKYISPYGNIMSEEVANKLWKLYLNENIPEHQRVVLMMTFDRAYIDKENYKRAEQDIRLFLNDYNDEKVVNHWFRIADIFRDEEKVPAIGFWMTSVSDNPFLGVWDEEKEMREVDWNNCFNVYEELKNMISENKDNQNA